MLKCGGLSAAGPAFPEAGKRRKNQTVSQLLAGTPSGPGGSSGTARVLMLRA